LALNIKAPDHYHNLEQKFGTKVETCKELQRCVFRRHLLIIGFRMSFEFRYHKFVYISDVSVLNERDWGFLRVKHMLYLFLAVIFLWRGYSAGSPAILSMGVVAWALALLSAPFSRALWASRRNY
jgi:hypothetical protein